jgi:hypothetical protein
MISNELLEKLKKIYQAKFNVSLTNEEATQMATDIVNLMKVLLEPEPQEIKEEGRQDETITTHTS